MKVALSVIDGLGGEGVQKGPDVESAKFWGWYLSLSEINNGIPAARAKERHEKASSLVISENGREWPASL